MTIALTLAAPAKVNLTLQITGQREDGFHLLESVIGFTAVADRITLTPADDITLAITGPEAKGLDEDSSNLTVRAAHLVKDHINASAGVHIALEKNIPVAAGLGGGSADAAATLAGCLELWHDDGAEKIDDETLAAALGADVPVCRYGKAAWVSGIGEIMSDVPPWPETWLVLVNPRVAVPTEQIFKTFSGSIRQPETDEAFRSGWGPSVDAFAAILGARENSLTEAVTAVAPVVDGVLSVLEAVPGGALTRMSGSGPTCFSLFATEAEAAAAAIAVGEANPEWWVRSTPLLARTSAEML